MVDTQDEKQTKISPLAQNAGILLLVAALAAFGAVLAYGATLKLTSPWVIGCLVVGFAALAGWFVGRGQSAHLPRDQYARQRSLMGANALISSVLFLVVLVGVNYVAARRHKTFDITNNKINSLADQSIKALTGLKDNVTFNYVYVPTFEQRGPAPNDQQLFEKYKLSSDKIRVAYIDATAEPKKLSELKLSVPSLTRPVLVIQGAKPAERQQVELIDEANITSALLKISDSKARVLYALTGHGELSFSASPPLGLGIAKGKLEGQNYSIKSLTLSGAKAEVPKDADVVAILGPRLDLSQSEAAVLQKYVQGKGRLLILLHPLQRPLPRWNALIKSLGFTVLDGIITDQEQFDRSPVNVLGLVTDTAKHPLLGGVGAGTNVLFPGAVPLKALASPPAGLTVTPLLESSKSSLATPFTGGGTGENGPFALAAAIERGSEANQMRAIVVGNALFAIDSFFARPDVANSDFFLSATNWVAGNSSLVSIPPKPPITNSITMTAGTRRFALVFSLFTLPLIVLMLGGIVWYRRR